MNKKFVSAEKPETVERMQYHISVKPGEIARYVLLPGDPERVEKIIKLWDQNRFVAKHREYLTYTGTFKGAPISVTSTGIGSPAAAIAVEELANVGADTFIRVGSTGVIRKEINIGDLVITTAAIRLEGTTKQYVFPEYPATAHYEVVLALIEAAESLGYRYFVGVTATTDSFYPGQARPGFKNYFPSMAASLLSDLMKANVINFEMEASSIFTLASIYGLRAGAVCAVYANRVTNEFGVEGEKEAAETASTAVKILYEWDQLKEEKGKKHFFPSLLK